MVCCLEIFLPNEIAHLFWALPYSGSQDPRTALMDAENSTDGRIDTNGCWSWLPCEAVSTAFSLQASTRLSFPLTLEWQRVLGLLYWVSKHFNILQHQLQRPKNSVRWGQQWLHWLLSNFHFLIFPLLWQIPDKKATYRRLTWVGGLKE